MSLLLGNTLLAGVSKETKSNAHSLLDYKWTDHILNEMSWLRCDTFSWHNGDLYVAAYNHLLNDYNSVPKPEVVTVVLENQTSPFVDGTYYKTSETFSGLDIWRKDNDPSGAAILIYPDAVIATGTTVYNTTFAQSSISYVNDGTTTETIGSYTIAYYLSSDGHKIVMPSQETTVQNIYNESGSSWYYILDTTNKKFKLPRSSHGNIIEKYQRGKDWYKVYSDGWCEQGGYIDTSATPTTVNLFKTYTSTNYAIRLTSAYNGNAYPATTNGTIATNSFQARTPNANVDFYWETSGYINLTKSNSQYKYLYFYVGDFDQTSTEQTAGLNTNLFNGKVDLDGNNAEFVHIIETYHSGSNYYRIYSDGWCEQGGFVARTAVTQAVTFHKEFVDTNYNIQMSVRHTTDSTDGRPPLIRNPSTTGFNVNLYTSYEGVYWKACGYILLT